MCHTLTNQFWPQNCNTVPIRRCEAIFGIIWWRPCQVYLKQRQISNLINATKKAIHQMHSEIRRCHYFMTVMSRACSKMTLKNQHYQNAVYRYANYLFRFLATWNFQLWFICVLSMTHIPGLRNDLLNCYLGFSKGWKRQKKIDKVSENVFT